MPSIRENIQTQDVIISNRIETVQPCKAKCQIVFKQAWNFCPLCGEKITTVAPLTEKLDKLP